VDPTANLRVEIFDCLLRMFPRGRLVDLGSGHGLFAVRAADQGWNVTAVDARATRFPADARITWQVQDIREHELTSYDLVLCLGLFYHLDLPDQLHLLANAKGIPIILDTHVAIARNPGKHQLSEEQEVDGYTGRWYSEPGDTTVATSSWGNTRSFWPTTDSLKRMLADHGYPVTLIANPWHAPDRTFFVALS
jgi:Methyltransferase domain